MGSKNIQDQRAVWPTWLGALGVGLIAICVFGFQLSSEPHFADESAYYSQSYFLAIFSEGRWNDPAWLEYPAYDLPPLPKYFIGLALRAGDFRLPSRSSAMAWYGNTSLQFAPPGALNVARIPSVIVGSLGCVAVYGLGVLIFGRSAGALAALFLMVNPLYRLHARRAMSDVPCEAFLLLALMFALWAWKNFLTGNTRVSSWLGLGLVGVFGGLSVLSKPSGTLAFMIVGAWAVLAVFVGEGLKRKFLYGTGAILAVVLAGLTFVAFDPYLTANPKNSLPGEMETVRRMDLLERARMMFKLRLQVSAQQQEMFPHNALKSIGQKVPTVAVQGFGRFGPFGPSHSDSTRRFDWVQDWGVAIWLPWVVLGVVWATWKGRVQRESGDPPTAWALLAYFAVALTVVAVYIPMAWDRYQLAVQAPSALLASAVAVAGFQRAVRVVLDPVDISQRA